MPTNEVTFCFDLVLCAFEYAYKCANIESFGGRCENIMIKLTWCYYKTLGEETKRIDGGKDYTEKLIVTTI